MTAAEIIRKAIESFENGGWTRGMWENGLGAACLNGLLCRAAGKNAYHDGANALLEEFPLVKCAALDALATHDTSSCQCELCRPATTQRLIDRIVRFNDDYATRETALAFLKHMERYIVETNERNAKEEP